MVTGPTCNYSLLKYLWVSVALNGMLLDHRLTKQRAVAVPRARSVGPRVRAGDGKEHHTLQFCHDIAVHHVRQLCSAATASARHT
jgi:hypothetical protein